MVVGAEGATYNVTPEALGGYLVALRQRAPVGATRKKECAVKKRGGANYRVCRWNEFVGLPNVGPAGALSKMPVMPKKRSVKQKKPALGGGGGGGGRGGGGGGLVFGGVFGEKKIPFFRGQSVRSFLILLTRLANLYCLHPPRWIS